MSSFTQILNIARSGMLARLSNLDLVSDNLANVTTAGFKRGRANFQELLDGNTGLANETNLNGTQIRGTQFMMDQGNLKQSDNPLDMAISGDGYFSITLPDGRTAFTRDGHFFLDAQNQIVTASGFKLNWDGQIPADAEDFHVNPDGSVMVLQAGVWSQAGTIQLNRFDNPSGLIRYGQSAWLETDISGQAQTGAASSDGFGSILGSAIEESNVNLAEEMVQMMNLQRSFEMSLRTFQQTDEMLSQAIHMRNG